MGEHIERRFGIKGKAFDSPETKRAYTYAHQPDNVVALKLGRAAQSAAVYFTGDNIDRGLALLKSLESEGFGVFELDEAGGGEG